MNKSIAPISFNILIAYLLPGFIALYGLTYISPAVKQVFNAVLIKDSQIGASFLLLLGATAAGVIISGVRGNIIDQCMTWFGVSKPDIDYEKMSDQNIREAFDIIINEQYRYAQSYGNFFLSLLFLLATKFFFSNIDIRTQWPLMTIILTTDLLMLICYGIYLNKAHESLINLTKQKSLATENTSIKEKTGGSDDKEKEG